MNLLLSLCLYAQRRRLTKLCWLEALGFVVSHTIRRLVLDATCTKKTPLDVQTSWGWLFIYCLSASSWRHSTSFTSCQIKSGFSVSFLAGWHRLLVPDWLWAIHDGKIDIDAILHSKYAPCSLCTKKSLFVWTHQEWNSHIAVQQTHLDGPIMTS